MFMFVNLMTAEKKQKSKRGFGLFARVSMI